MATYSIYWQGGKPCAYLMPSAELAEAALDAGDAVGVFSAVGTATVAGDTLIMRRRPAYRAAGEDMAAMLGAAARVGDGFRVVYSEADRD